MNWIPELPLLRRELTELANRRRTYIVRVVGAIGILFFTFIAYQQTINGRLTQRGSLSTQFLGIGGDVFREITPTLFYAIQLLIPALCCATVTSEKESNTFGTLLLTRLTPGGIIVEKFLSRLVPMLTLLALTFPILAHIYSLGGVDTGELIGTLWLLFVECLLFASISILCSAWFATTVAAFTVSYFLTGLLAVMSLSLSLNTFVPSAVWEASQDITPRLPETGIGISIQFYLSKLGLVAADGPVPRWLWMIARSIPALIATTCFLTIARFVVVRRAFVTHTSVMMKVFRSVDAFFKHINDRATGGILIMADRNLVPTEDPVIWREQNKKSLGKFRYLLRILVVLEFPTLLICAYAAVDSARRSYDGLYIMQAVVWMLAAVVTMVKAATLFTSERANQTIEPLLATPMSTIDIANQKVRGMRRLTIVLAVPVLTVNFTHSLVSINNNRFDAAITYLFLSVCGCFILLRLIAWVSLGIGLRIHSQTKAVLTCFAVFGAWVILPRMLLSLVSPSVESLHFFSLLSPVSVPYSVEAFLNSGWQRRQTMNGTIEQAPWGLWAVSTITLYAMAGFLVSFLVRRGAGRLLQRRDSSDFVPDELLIDTIEESASNGNRGDVS